MIEPMTMMMAAGAISGGVSALSNIIGGAIAAGATQGERDKAQAAQNEALKEIMSINAPPDMAREILIERFKSAGVYTPKLEEAILQGTSKMAELQESDPSLREAQKSALEAYKEVGRTGLSAEDRLAMRQARTQAENANRARLESIKQNLAARGMGGAGAEIAAQLSSGQQAAEDLSMSADRTAAQAQQARLAALARMSDLGGSMRTQDWQQAAQRAGAADELARFNVMQRSGVQQRNVGAQNQGQLFNLQNAQQIANMNTQAANAEKLRQRQGEGQTWQMGAQRAGARGGAQQAISNYYQQAAANKAANIMGVAGGIGQTAGAIGGNLMQYAKYAGKAIPKADVEEDKSQVLPSYYSPYTRS